MAAAKIILFDSPSKARKDGTFPVCLKITHKRKRKYFSLDKHALSKQWNADSGRFRKNYPNHNSQNELLLIFEARANEIIRNFERDDKPFSLEAFEKEFLKEEEVNTVEAYYQARIESLINAGKVGSASPHKTTINAIWEFAPTKGYDPKKLRLSEIDYKFLIDFEEWLKTVRECKDTSVSVYMRSLRSILNRAIREGLLKKENYPFDQYRLSERLNTQTQRRAIDKAKIKEIEALQFSDGSKEQLAQNIFLFSYYNRGINFADIAYLTKENISGERLMYVRQKTGKPFNIKLLPKAREIIEYYKTNPVFGGKYLFPIFDEATHITPEQQHHRKKTVLKQVNKCLREIAKMIGEEDLNLTTYVGRHTYATTLKKSGKSIALISEAMGHSSEKVTQTYLKSFENSELDEADESLL